MTEIEQKIRARAYKTKSVAGAVVKRADISPQKRNKLLALVEESYHEFAAEIEPQDADELDDEDKQDVTIVQPPKFMNGDKALDDKLLKISFNLLILCVEYKLSRKEIYKRLHDRLMAGID